MSQTARRGLSDASGMTGGMADQAGSRMSAAEMASLGQIGMGREAAMRGLEREEMAAPLAAFSDAQQIDQWSKAMEQYERQMGYEDTLRGREDVLFDQSQEDRERALADIETDRERQALQDIYNKQAINAQQRVDILQQRDYWRGVLSDPATAENRELQAMAQQNLDRLDAEYSTLLADYGRLNNEALQQSGGEPTPEPGPTPEPTPPPRPEPGPGETAESVTQDWENEVTNWIDTELSFNKDIPITRLNDAVSAVKELAPDNVPDDYNYASEMDLINKYYTSPSEMTLNEFNRIQGTALKTVTTSAGGPDQTLNRYASLVGLSSSAAGTVGTNINLKFDNEQHRNFVQYLVTQGIIQESNIQKTNTVYRLVGTGSNLSEMGRQYNNFLQGQNAATLEDSEARW
jgi:hypothetical protein